MTYNQTQNLNGVQKVEGRLALRLLNRDGVRWPRGRLKPVMKNVVPAVNLPSTRDWVTIVPWQEAAARGQGGRQARQARIRT